MFSLFLPQTRRSYQPRLGTIADVRRNTCYVGATRGPPRAGTRIPNGAAVPGRRGQSQQTEAPWFWPAAPTTPSSIT